MPAGIGYTTDVREVKDVVASTRANTFIGKKKKKIDMKRIATYMQKS